MHVLLVEKNWSLKFRNMVRVTSIISLLVLKVKYSSSILNNSFAASNWLSLCLFFVYTEFVHGLDFYCYVIFYVAIMFYVRRLISIYLPTY